MLFAAGIGSSLGAGSTDGAVVSSGSRVTPPSGRGGSALTFGADSTGAASAPIGTRRGAWGSAVSGIGSNTGCGAGSGSGSASFGPTGSRRGPWFSASGCVVSAASGAGASLASGPGSAIAAADEAVVSGPAAGVAWGAREAPQVVQNRASASFSAPQLGQSMRFSLQSARGSVREQGTASQSARSECYLHYAPAYRLRAARACRLTKQCVERGAQALRMRCVSRALRPSRGRVLVIPCLRIGVLARRGRRKRV